MKRWGQKNKKKAVTKLGIVFLTLNVALFFAKGDYKAHSIQPLQTSLFDFSIDMKAYFCCQDDDPTRLSSDEHYNISFHKQTFSVYWANDSLPLDSDFSENNVKRAFTVNSVSQSHKNKPIRKWKIKTTAFAALIKSQKIFYILE